MPSPCLFFIVIMIVALQDILCIIYVQRIGSHAWGFLSPHEGHDLVKEYSLKLGAWSLTPRWASYISFLSAVHDLVSEYIFGTRCLGFTPS